MNNTENTLYSHEQVIKEQIEIITQKEYDKLNNEEKAKHDKFLDAEPWRKYIKWKILETKKYAVKKPRKDKYSILKIIKYGNENKYILHIQENLDELFKHHPLLNSFKYDEYSKTKEFNGEKYDEDKKPAEIFNFFRRNFDEWSPKENIKDTIQETLNNNTYNFLCDYFDSLVWDGIPRLDTFLIDYYGAEDNPLVRAYFSRWIIALVKRSYSPSAKFDAMLILSSIIQGKKKTSLFEWLGTINSKKLYNDVPDDLKNLQELIYATKGKAIMLFDDFDDICDKGKIGKVKSFITQRNRTAALKWQHENDYEVTYVLAGTTNNISILVDDATFDERRFWIVEVNPQGDVFDIPDEIKEQLYAEAVYRYKQEPDQYLWIWEKELKNMEIEWQKKFKKANEDTTIEKIVNIFNEKYPIKNGQFKDKEQFLYYMEHKTTTYIDDKIFNINECDNIRVEHLEYIKIIPSAWLIEYLKESTRGTDRIVQILHTQGFNVEKLQRYLIYDKQLTVIKINGRPKHESE